MGKGFWTALGAAMLLVSCGGGDPATVDTGAALASAPLATADNGACLTSSTGNELVDGQCVKVFQGVQPQRFAAQPQRALPVLTDAALFDWAQLTFPQFFGGPFQAGVISPFDYRYYPLQNTYLAVANGGVYVLGPVSNFQVMFIAPLTDFTCSVFSCSSTGGGGGGGGSIDWNSAFSAQEIIDDGPTLAPHARQGWSFNVTGGSLPVETIFAAQFTASLYVMPVSDLNACVNGGAFNFYSDFSFPTGNFGFKSFSLPVGSYGVCLVNDSNVSNGTRLELQNQLTVDGFHFTQTAFTTLARSIGNGGRLTQPVTVGDNYRVIVDGGNSGGEFFIIPASEQQNFLNGGSFNFYSDMTNACGQSDRAAPGLCELTGVGDYAIAYRNNTGSSQSIVVVGRVYFPN
jgi:hypothetical protein